MVIKFGKCHSRELVDSPRELLVTLAVMLNNAVDVGKECAYGIVIVQTDRALLAVLLLELGPQVGHVECLELLLSVK